MKPTALRWGILGVAHINRRLLPAFAAAVNARLWAIASRSAEKAQNAAAAAGIPRAHASYEALSMIRQSMPFISPCPTICMPNGP